MLVVIYFIWTEHQYINSRKRYTLLLCGAQPMLPPVRKKLTRNWHRKKLPCDISNDILKINLPIRIDQSWIHTSLSLREEGRDGDEEAAATIIRSIQCGSKTLNHTGPAHLDRLLSARRALRSLESWKQTLWKQTLEPWNPENKTSENRP